MFHVSTMLPYTPNNKQQVSRAQKYLNYWVFMTTLIYYYQKNHLRNQK